MRERSPYVSLTSRLDSMQNLKNETGRIYNPRVRSYFLGGRRTIVERMPVETDDVAIDAPR